MTGKSKSWLGFKSRFGHCLGVIRIAKIRFSKGRLGFDLIWFDAFHDSIWWYGIPRSNILSLSLVVFVISWICSLVMVNKHGIKWNWIALCFCAVFHRMNRENRQTGSCCSSLVFIKMKCWFQWFAVLNVLVILMIGIWLGIGFLELGFGF